MPPTRVKLSSRLVRRKNVTVGDYLTLIGELAIGVAGFSGVVAALTRRSTGEWRPVDVVRLQGLLRISIGVAMWAVVTALLLSAGVPEPLLWRTVSGSWFVLTAIGVFSMARLVRARLAASREDASRGLSVFVVTGALVSFALQAVNALLLAAAWPHLTALAWGLFISLVLFLRLATVAFAPTQPAA